MGAARLAAGLAILTALQAISLAPGASAQGEARRCANTEFAARSEPLGEFGPFAGASFKAEPYHEVTGPACRILTFYRIAAKIPESIIGGQRSGTQQAYVDKVAAPFFAARYIDSSREGAYRPRWTDQNSCPTLLTVLKNLEPVLAPVITGDGPYQGVALARPDAPIIRLWMTTQVWPQTDPDYTQNYALDGGHDGPFGQWLEEAFRELDGCWRAEAPSAP